MDEEESKTCTNCKRDIPAVNYTIHIVHCARNIRACPVCKEPVPLAQLQEHHDTMHKLLPCKQCGESVAGTDMEDHIRDSCEKTITSCRFCSLELPRRELPAHEGYCGARTEQCEECKEWVMLKYRQLHIDSNHGFIRLDDDPAPIPKKEPKLTNLAKPSNLNVPSTSNGYMRPTRADTNGHVNMPKTEIRYLAGPSGVGSSQASARSHRIPIIDPRNGEEITSNGMTKAPLKRTNDQPQINTTVTTTDKVKKVLASRGAVKKRAPAPPSEPRPQRDLPYYSALQRQQEEDRLRREQTAYNLARGLPPVLSPAAKLEKLRKMDKLQNPGSEPADLSNVLQGRVWRANQPDVPIGHVLGSNQNERDNRLESNRRNDLNNLKPMTPEQFMERFNELQLREPDRGGDRHQRKSERNNDRFSEIKSSLRELRRGLNEVTAPYNMNGNSVNQNEQASGGRGSRPVSPQVQSRAHTQAQSRAQAQVQSGADELDVQLPCEFCGVAVPAGDLVQHQTGCRPDLAQFRPRSNSGRARQPPRQPPMPPPDLDDPRDPVIPCEFCTESLPIYLISEHQERCGRETNLLYPD